MYHRIMQSRQSSSTRALKAQPARAPRGKLLNEVVSILFFGLGAFVLVALVTYSPSDPSFFTNSNEPARNACGRVGAFISSLFLECFGVAAFLIPAVFLFMAATAHKREGSVRLVGTMGGMSMAVTAMTVFLTLQWRFWEYGGATLLTGGAFGAWLAEVLSRFFNSMGASIVSVVAFCIAVAVSTPVSVARVVSAICRTVGVVAWRVSKLVGGYAFYLGSLFAMRAAHGAGDAIQGFLEKAARTAREKAALRAAQKELKVKAALEARKADPSDEQSDEAGEPVIALADSGDFDADGSGDAVEGGSTASDELGLDEPALLPPPDGVSSPMEQMDLSPVSRSAKLKSNGPEILPPSRENDGEEKSKVQDAASKAAAKLARIARATKRGAWKLPPVDFLRKPPKVESQIDRDRLIKNSEILRQKFADFGIQGEVTAVRPGPVITLYEFKPGPGVKVSRIAALADDLSMALSAQSVRILAPLPGKAVVGIEIPSDSRETVFLREFLQHPDFHGPKHSIPVVMGKDIGGQPYLSDLARMPHLLCAGQTGSGKSVFMNGLICSLLYRFTPDELRMILVDPKFIEFRSYQDIPHLLLPVVDDPKQASTALKWAVREMERRYRILAMMGVRNLAGFNQKVEEMGSDVVRDLLLSEENQSEGMAQMSGGDWLEAFEPDENGAPRIGKLPCIVVIIDELADLMMIAKKEVEISIARIAQKARAAGIHLVIATQRPSTDVVTGLIKANLPSRVSFQLASYVDSKTILDRAGAERLLGQGDMLFIPPGLSQLLRLHGAFVDDDEIGKITSFLKSQGKPVYRDEILVDEEEEAGEADGEEAGDELFDEAVELVRRSGHASASFLQRHLKVGYNRAARMIETMEARGIVGPPDGARPREVLMR